MGISHNVQISSVCNSQSAYPIHVYRLARELGIQILPSDCLPDNISGIIAPDETDPGHYVISINAAHPNHRRRFTIAHELAHFILHRNLIGDGITDDRLYRSRLSYKNEVEANELAMDILMPWQLLSPLLQNDRINVTELADLFDVSPSVMSTRLHIPVECRIR